MTEVLKVACQNEGAQISNRLYSAPTTGFPVILHAFGGTLLTPGLQVRRTFPHFTSPVARRQAMESATLDMRLRFLCRPVYGESERPLQGWHA